MMRAERDSNKPLSLDVYECVVSGDVADSTHKQTHSSV